MILAQMIHIQIVLFELDETKFKLSPMLLFRLNLVSYAGDCFVCDAISSQQDHIILSYIFIQMNDRSCLLMNQMGNMYNT